MHRASLKALFVISETHFADGDCVLCVLHVITNGACLSFVIFRVCDPEEREEQIQIMLDHCNEKMENYNKNGHSGCVMINIEFIQVSIIRLPLLSVL